MPSSLEEFHGPGLLYPTPGWLLVLDYGDFGLGPADSKSWIRLRISLHARLERLLPGIGCSLTEDPEDFLIALASRLVHPVKLDSYPMGWTEKDCRVRRRLIRSRRHQLAGDALRLSLDICRVCLQRAAVLDSQARLLRSSSARIRNRACALVSHPFTNAVIDEAAQRGLNFDILLEEFSGLPLIQLGMGARSRTLVSTCADADSYIGGNVCRNKSYSSQLLARLGYRVPRQIWLPKSATRSQLANAAAEIGFPCVIKPSDAELGRGITIGIRDKASLMTAATEARAVARQGLVLEEHVPGDYHRLLVLEGQLVRVTRYEPPHLIGDGKRSIQAILLSPSSNQSLPGGVLAYGSPPCLDDATIQQLHLQDLTPESVPVLGRKVVLRCDLKDREDWIDTKLLDSVDSSIFRLAEGISKALGMANVGIDVLSPDITRPAQSRQLWIIEVNAMQRMPPGMAPLILSQMFSRPEYSRIPVHVVVCAEESDWPEPEALQLLLASHAGFALAIPRRLEVRLDPQSRLDIEKDQGLFLYDHPREVLLSRGLNAALFLIDWKELHQSGLPAIQVNQLQMLGRPPVDMAQSWHRLKDWVLPRSGEHAYCKLPTISSTKL